MVHLIVILLHKTVKISQIGYEQDDCSENTDDCLTAVCLNNSTCTDLIANYSCKCQPGYEGQRCEMGKFFGINVFNL